MPAIDDRTRHAPITTLARPDAPPTIGPSRRTPGATASPVPAIDAGEGAPDTTRLALLEAPALPLPGSGRTWDRMLGLAEMAGRDLSLGRIHEGHADAVAILAEAGRDARPGALYGVWAARSVSRPMTAVRSDSGWRLAGTKEFCSGIGIIDRALVSAEAHDGYRLFDVDLRGGGMTVVDGSWPAVGMSGSFSLTLGLDAVAVGDGDAVGAAGFYTCRPGFWFGAAGVAACWYGGARALVERLIGSLPPAPSDHVLTDLGRAVACVGSMRACLRRVAEEIDADPTDASGRSRYRALAVRETVHEACTEVLALVAGAGGGPPPRPRPRPGAAGRRPVRLPQPAPRRFRCRRARPTRHRRRPPTMLTVDSDHLGTPETSWRRSGRLGAVEPLALGAWSRVVVVAPHPDDEVLGAGGLLRRLAGMGVPISIVAVTDGESSHPGSPAAARIDLRARRADERDEALGRLLGGAGEPPLPWHAGGPPPVRRLGLPDGDVAGHEARLREVLVGVLEPGDVCVAPWSADGHPDHDAVGRAATAATAVRDCDLLGFLVWAWHWARPEDDDIPWAQCRRVDLTRRDAARKRWATAAFTSQIRPLGPHPDDGPVLPDEVVRRSWRTNEIFVAAGPT